MKRHGFTDNGQFAANSSPAQVRESTSQENKRHPWLSAVQKNAKIIINAIVILLTSGKVAVVAVRKAFRAGWVTLTAQPCLMWIYKKDFKGQACQIQGQCLLLTH